MHFLACRRISCTRWPFKPVQTNFSQTRKLLFDKTFKLDVHTTSRQLHGRTYLTSVIAPRIRAILERVGNSHLVTIHALWYISKIITADTCHGNDFLGISVFNHLHCLGTSSLDDLVFSAFVVAARLADKSVNDTCLSCKIWCVRHHFYFIHC